MEGQKEGEWVALSNRHVQQVCMQLTIPTSSGTYPSFTYTGELGYDGPLYDRFLHMTDDILGPSLMHIKYR